MSIYVVFTCIYIFSSLYRREGQEWLDFVNYWCFLNHKSITFSCFFISIIYSQKYILWVQTPKWASVQAVILLHLNPRKDKYHVVCKLVLVPVFLFSTTKEVQSLRFKSRTNLVPTATTQSIYCFWRRSELFISFDWDLYRRISVVNVLGFLTADHGFESAWSFCYCLLN